MNTGNTFLLWTPRLLLIAFALFLVIFSFDVFEEGKSGIEIGVAFAIHNIPSLFLGLVVFASWRREWIGALTCLVIALAYIVWAWGRFPPITYLIMTGPVLVIAALYGVNWRLRHHQTPRP